MWLARSSKAVPESNPAILANPAVAARDFPPETDSRIPRIIQATEIDQPGLAMLRSVAA
jgi:hypothetical protein